MRILKLGSRTIRVYFSDKKVDEYEKSKRGKVDGYCHGYSDKETDTICVRSGLPNTLKRICFWHELGHLVYDFLGSLSDESLTEINARLIDEILSRNRWVKEMY